MLIDIEAIDKHLDVFRKGALDDKLLTVLRVRCIDAMAGHVSNNADGRLSLHRLLIDLIERDRFSGNTMPDVSAAALSRLAEDLDTGYEGVTMKPMVALFMAKCSENEAIRVAALRGLEAYCRRKADKHAADTIVCAKTHQRAPSPWNAAILGSLHWIVALLVHPSSVS